MRILSTWNELNAKVGGYILNRRSRRASAARRRSVAKTSFQPDALAQRRLFTVTQTQDIPNFDIYDDLFANGIDLDDYFESDYGPITYSVTTDTGEWMSYDRTGNFLSFELLHDGQNDYDWFWIGVGDGDPEGSQAGAGEEFSIFNPPKPTIRIDVADPQATEGAGDDAVFQVTASSSELIGITLRFSGAAVAGSPSNGVPVAGVDYHVYRDNDFDTPLAISNGEAGVSFSSGVTLHVRAISDGVAESLEDLTITIVDAPPKYDIVKPSDDGEIVNAAPVPEIEPDHGKYCVCCSCTDTTEVNRKQNVMTGVAQAAAAVAGGISVGYQGVANGAASFLGFRFRVPEGVSDFSRIKFGGSVGGVGGATLQDLWLSGSNDPRGEWVYVAAPLDNPLAIGKHAADLEITYEYADSTTETVTATVDYFSVDRGDGPLGAGWTLRGHSRLYVQDDGLFFDFADGNFVFFRDMGSGVFKADPSPHIHQSAEIVLNQDLTYTYNDGHGYLQNFRADGYLLEKIDRDGNVTEYVYSDLDSDSVAESLTSIFDPAGRETVLEYVNGKLYKSTGYDGTTSEFAYNLDGTLASITTTDPDGTTGAQLAPVTSFTYDGTSKRLASITDAEDRVFEYTYDAHGFLASVSETGPSNETITTEYEIVYGDLLPGTGEGTSLNPLDYSFAKDMTAKKIDHDGKITEYVFNRFGQAAEIHHFDGTVTKSTFSDSGLLLEINQLDPDGAGPLTARVTTYTYDSNGNVSSITYADDSTESFVYDLDWNDVTSYTDQLGRVTLYSLDATYGRVTSVTRVMGDVDDSINLETDDAVVAFTYTQSSGGVKGLVETTTDAEGAVTKFVYDSLGRVEKAIYAFGESIQADEEFEYDSGDRITAHENELGYRTEFVYDFAGRLIETIHPDLDGVGVGDDPVSTFYKYNQLGYLIEVTSPLQREQNGSTTNRTTQTLYEDNFYRVRSRRPDHDSNGFATDTVVQYDWLGRIDSTTDELGRVTDYQYDTLRRLQKIVSPDPDGDVTSSEISLTYDAWGRLKTQTDALGHVTEYEYDAMDRVIKIKHPDLGGGVRAEEEFVYDDAGQLVEYIDALDRKTKYAYDDFGRPLSVTLPNANGSDGTVPNVVYAYDENGNLTSETKYPDVADLNKKIVTTYAYDARNRLISITEPKAKSTDASAPVTQFGYYADDSLHYVIDAEGRRTDYHYDEWGRLERTELPDLDTNPFNARLDREIKYDYAGRVISTTDALGFETNYEYDLLDNLKKVKLPSADGTAPRATREYVYDAKSQLTSETNELGKVTGYVYDELGRLKTVTAPDPDGAGTAYSSPVTVYGYDKNGQLTKITDALLGVTDYGYDAMGRRTSVTQPIPDGPNGTDDRPVTSFTYDLLGQLTSETAPDPDGAGGDPAAVTSYEYDALGRLKKITRPDVNTTDGIANDTEYTYDRLGRMISETDALGRVTTYDYDNLDRLWKVTKPTTTGVPAGSPVIEYGYDKVGQLVSVKDPLNRTTSYEYDALGRRTKMTQPDPDGATVTLSAPVTTYTYDAEGRLLTTLAPGDRLPLTQYEYDRLGRLIKRTDPDPDKNGTASNGAATSPVTNYGYDAAGNLTEVSSPEGDILYERDALGRVTTELRTNPGQGVGTTFLYEYDALGRRTEVTNDVGTTNYVYDALGRLIEEKLPDPDGAGSNGRPTTKYTYDAVGNLKTLTDPELNVHEYDYDVLNRLVTETDPRNEQTTYEYDYVGNLKKKTDRRGLVTEYGYDALDRRTSETWKNGATTVNQIDYAYDKADQLTSTSDDWSAYAYTYDSLGRVKTVDNNGTYDVPRVILTNVYDDELRRSEVSATINGTNDFKNTYDYDTLGRLARLRQTSQASGNAVQDKAAIFTYDSAGRITSILRRESLNTTRVVGQSDYEYDTDGRLIELTHTSPTATIVQYIWDYDSAGRLVAAANTKDGVTTYDYDDTNQLIEANHSSQPDEAYAYDENGNRIGTGISTGTGNRVTNDGTYTYQYDDEGNRTRRTLIATGAYTTYKWDHRNRLTEAKDYNVSNVLQKTTTIVYDVFDRRIAKDVDATVDFGYRYVYDSLSKYDVNGHPVDDVVLVFNTTHTATAPIRRYLHGAGVDQILSEEIVGGETYWTLTDQLGNVRDRVLYNDVNGLVRWASHFVFDSFGNLVSEIDGVTGAVLTNAKSLNHQNGPVYGFAGREWDTDLGMYYNRARWYDPKAGRFISQDPIFDDTTNTYRYVGNGPTNATDPSGLRNPFQGTVNFDYLAWQMRHEFASMYESWFGGHVPTTPGEPLHPHKLGGATGGLAAYGSNGLLNPLLELRNGSPSAQLGVRQSETYCEVLDPTGMFVPAYHVRHGETPAGDPRDRYEAGGDLLIAGAINGLTMGAARGRRPRFKLPIPPRPTPRIIDPPPAIAPPMISPGRPLVPGSGDAEDLMELMRRRQPGLDDSIAEWRQLREQSGASQFGQGWEMMARRRIGKFWPAKKPTDPTIADGGCEYVVPQIIRHLGGGTPARIVNRQPQFTLGPYNGDSAPWFNHHVVIKEGRVYDELTGYEGLPIDEYKDNWNYGDELDFGF